MSDWKARLAALFPHIGMSCRGKIPFRSNGAALQHLRVMEARGIDVGDCSTYRCGVCGDWHFGHSTRAQMIAAEIDGRTIR